VAIRVLIADDHPLLRSALRHALRRFDDIKVVGEADTGRTAIAQAHELRPEVVLMDVRIPGGDGIEATEETRRSCPETQVLILTVYGELDLFRRAAAAGAAGFVLKDITTKNLVAAIRAVYRGNTMINPRIARQLLEDIAHGGDAGRGPAARLTDREMEILINVAHGLSDKELATQLFLAESTVKTHLRDIYRKLDVRNRVQAATYAIQNNLATDMFPDRDLAPKATGKASA